MAVGIAYKNNQLNSQNLHINEGKRLQYEWIKKSVNIKLQTAMYTIIQQSEVHKKSKAIAVAGREGQ
jgi:hypothetical protein